MAGFSVVVLMLGQLALDRFVDAISMIFVE
jgi:hypothetical protein